MHTDETLEVLEIVSGNLGSQLRIFAHDTCSAFSTRELRREAESHRRRQVQEGMSGITRDQGTSATVTGERRPRLLNLQTYKLHALGDYAAHIRMYRTTDSYSTQVVSLSCTVTGALAFVHVLSLGRARAPYQQTLIHENKPQGFYSSIGCHRVPSSTDTAYPNAKGKHIIG